MDTVEVLADYNDMCGESPVWSARQQTLYWADITGQRLYKYCWKTRSAQILQSGFEVSGIALHEGGGLLLANSNGLWIWSEGHDPCMILDRIDGRLCSFNDCIADPAGRIFAGTCYFSSGTDYELGFLTRVDVDGTGEIVDEGIHLANGLAFSPDGSTLYFTDSALRRIYAYDYRAADGRICNRRVFVAVPVDQGVPDGLTVDAEGFVWSAQWFGGCVVRYDPDGKEERRIGIPASQTSSLCFGGDDLADLFVTSASAWDALSLAPAQVEHPGRPGGALYHVGSMHRGLPEYEGRQSVPDTFHATDTHGPNGLNLP